MEKSREFRGVLLFTLLSILWSWPILFIINIWLVPDFLVQDNIAAASFSQLFGHMLAMIGPALAALIMWRTYHKESPPPFYLLGTLALVQVACQEGANSWTLAPLAKDDSGAINS